MKMKLNPKIHPLLAVVLLLLAFGIIGCCSANNMMFPAPKPSYSDSPEILKLDAAGTQIAAIYLKSSQSPAKATFLYCHGNAEDIGEMKTLLAEYAARGCNVLAFDYPGYGLSKGSPSQDGCLKSVDSAYKYLVETLAAKPEEIVILGRSIGSGPACWLAVKNKVGGLIVESGFTSTFAVIATSLALIPLDSFQNLAQMEKLKCPVLVIHGRNDEVIPFSHGERLFSAAKQPKACLWVKDAGHNDIIAVAGEKYWTAFDAFIKMARKQEH